MTDADNAEARDSLRLLTWNIHFDANDQLGRVGGVLARLRPDVVALQEVVDQPTLAGLAGALEMDFAFGETGQDFHLGWLSRLPLHRAVNHRSEKLSKTLLEIRIDVSGQPVSLFATHLASRHDAQTPREEVAVILDILRTRAGMPHLLVGDFNSLAPGDTIGTPPSGVIRRGEAVPGTPRPAITQVLAAGYVDCFRQVHPAATGYSYQSHHPWLRLDYIFASPEFAACLAWCNVIADAATARASDHLPLEAAFSPASWMSNTKPVRTVGER